ncbi:MAG: hypothetical protein KatS3mg113_0418 [Planctomycetaceae bacterium]|nr:MAG: hypothetical protein KatS3mg113_0418 [Planctomycetaceae bacterium]
MSSTIQTSDVDLTGWEEVVKIWQLPAGGRRSIVVDDVPAVLLRHGNEVFAIEDVCTHDGQPLTEGPIEQGGIVCPRHGAIFDLKTGQPRRMPATQPVRVFPVHVTSDAIYVWPRLEPPSFLPSATIPEELSDVRAHANREAVAAQSSAADSQLEGRQNMAPSSSAPTEEVAPISVAASCEATLPSTETTVSELQVIEALRQVVDPELFVNIIDLGLVYTINIHDGKVEVEMTLTSPACPAGPQLVHQARTVLERLPGVRQASIKLVMSPPWTPDRMTDDARDQLGIF